MEYKVGDAVIFYKYDGYGTIGEFKEGDICTIIRINSIVGARYKIHVAGREGKTAQLGEHEIKLINHQERLNRKYGVKL